MKIVQPPFAVCMVLEGTSSVLISAWWAFLCFNSDFNMCASVWLSLPTSSATDYGEGTALTAGKTP